MNIRHLLAALAAVVAILAASSESSAQSAAYLSHVDSAQTAIDSTRWASAERHLLEAMRLEPGSPGNILLMSNLGIVQFQQGRGDEAIATLNSALGMAPNAVVVLTNRARLLAAMGRNGEAFADYSRVIALDSTQTSALFNRGMLAMAGGDLTTARADFASLQRQKPDARETAMAMAALLTRDGDYEEAIPWYTRLIESDPTDEFYLGRAVCLTMLDEYSVAMSDVNEGLKLNPQNAELYAQRAIINRLQYRNREYEADMRRAAELGYKPVVPVRPQKKQ